MPLPVMGFSEPPVCVVQSMFTSAARADTLIDSNDCGGVEYGLSIRIISLGDDVAGETGGDFVP